MTGVQVTAAVSQVSVQTVENRLTINTEPPTVLKVPMPQTVEVRATVTPLAILKAPAAQGPAGPALAITVVLQQMEPSLTWTLVHGLNRYPVPVFQNTAGDILSTTYRYLDRNTIEATFGAPTSGTAYIN